MQNSQSEKDSQSGTPSPSQVPDTVLCRGNATTEETVETEESKMINIQVGKVIFTAELMKNSSAEAFAQKLAEGPLTVEMHDYGNFEKVGALGFDLPTNNEQITTEPGDVTVTFSLA